MLNTVMRKVEVTGDGVRQGDVLEVGGLLHRVREVCELRGRRRRLQFENGDVYVLGSLLVITVARAYGARTTVGHLHAQEVGRLSSDTTLQEDFG